MKPQAPGAPPAAGLNPLIRKELAARMRSSAAPASITLFVLLLAGTAFLIYLFGTAGSARKVGSTGDSGGFMFYFLVVMQLIAAAFITPAFAAGTLSGERQRGTLQLLRLTALTPRQIILSKFAVAMAYALLFICASLPLFSLAFLLGSIEPVELVMALCVVLSSAVMFVALALYASSRARTRALSSVAIYSASIAIVIGLPLLLLIATTVAQSALPETLAGPGAQTLRALAEGAIGFGLSLSPFIAILYSRTWFAETNDALFFQQKIFEPAASVTLPSPYITLTLVYLALSALFLFLATRNLAREEE